MTTTTLNPGSVPTPSLRQTIVKNGWQWPMLVVFLLSIPVVSHMYLIWKVTHDPTFAIESDYYKKALGWDATMAQARTNTQLGWHAAVTPVAAGDGTDLSVVVEDAAGQPVKVDSLHVEGFFLARSSDQQKGDAALGPDARWHVRLALPHAGLHEVRLTAKRGGDTFTSTHRLDLTR